MRFDWYGASLPAPIEVVQGALLHEFGGAFGPEPPRHSFEMAARHRPTQMQVMWGGQNPHPYVQGSGDEAAALATFLRREFPRHRLSRADVALDFDAPDAFERLAGILERIGDEAGVARLFYESDTGRTIYRGSRSSDVRIRLYEKGRKELGEGAQGVSEGWVRLELQVRPRKDRKALCAALSPSELFGLAQWSRRVVEEVARELVPFVPDPTLRLSDDDRALDHMCRQYGRVMRRRIEERGPQSLMLMILSKLEDQARRDRSR